MNSMTDMEMPAKAKTLVHQAATLAMKDGGRDVVIADAAQEAPAIPKKSVTADAPHEVSDSARTVQ